MLFRWKLNDCEFHANIFSDLIYFLIFSLHYTKWFIFYSLIIFDRNNTFDIQNYKKICYKYIIKMKYWVKYNFLCKVNHDDILLNKGDICLQNWRLSLFLFIEYIWHYFNDYLHYWLVISSDDKSRKYFSLNICFAEDEIASLPCNQTHKLDIHYNVLWSLPVQKI